MSKPTQIWLESQFPLDENHGVTEEMGQTFAVLVDWHDPQESPSQAVNRLNLEVIETDVLLRGARDDVAAHEAADQRIGEFKILSADQTAEYHQYHEGVRAIMHHPCSTIVGALSVVEAPLTRLVQAARDHDCSAEALVYATREGKLVAQRAISLLHGSDTASCSPEYLRALTEMVCDLTALSDRKDEVADFLWASANITGDRPAI